MWWYDDECAEAEDEIWDLYGQINLAKTADATDSSSEASFGAEFVKGASVGAIATLGAIFVIR